MSETAVSPEERIVLTSPDDTIVLKQLMPEDAGPYRELIAYDEDHLRQFDDSTANKYPDVESIRSSIVTPQDPSKYRFGIWEGDTMVGSINLTPAGGGRAEVGWLVGKQHVGHGFAGRAAKPLIDFAFHTLGFHEVHCEVVVGNEASRRTAEKAGFKLVAKYPNDHEGHSWRLEIHRADYEQ